MLRAPLQGPHLCRATEGSTPDVDLSPDGCCTHHPHTAALRALPIRDSLQVCVAQVVPVMETPSTAAWGACMSYQRTSPLLICSLQLLRIFFLNQSSVDWHNFLCTVLCFLNIAQTSFHSKLINTQ